MGGFLKGLAKKLVFVFVVSVLLLVVSGYSLYLGKSIADVFVTVYLATFIMLSIAFYRFKNLDIDNFLRWRFFETVGYGVLALFLCVVTEKMFHHFVLATTALVLFFTVIPSTIYVLIFNKKTLIK